MDLSIVIINYNTYELTAQCIRSLFDFVNGVQFEIIVVDNASTKENPDMFLYTYPTIQLIKSPVNLGFAKGNNLGIQQAKGRYILLLNSDTYLIEDCISIAVNAFKNLKNPGALSVYIQYPDGKFQHTARKFRTIKGEILDLCRPILHFISYSKRAKMLLNQHFNGDFDTEADWVSGAFMMFEKSLLNNLPEKKLDERFFMYGEDMLWCFHFKQLGRVNYYISNAKVVHIANASTDSNKQMQLLKVMRQHELKVLKEIYGNGIYFLVLNFIFSAKEIARYFIKVLAWQLFKKKIR